MPGRAMEDAVITQRRLNRINERNRERYAERVAAGLCFRCAAPVCDGSRAYCGDHLVEMRKRVKRMLLKRLRQPQPTGAKA